MRRRLLKSVLTSLLVVLALNPKCQRKYSREYKCGLDLWEQTIPNLIVDTHFSHFFSQTPICCYWASYSLSSTSVVSQLVCITQFYQTESLLKFVHSIPFTTKVSSKAKSGQNVSQQLRHNTERFKKSAVPSMIRHLNE